MRRNLRRFIRENSFTRKYERVKHAQAALCELSICKGDYHGGLHEKGREIILFRI